MKLLSFCGTPLTWHAVQFSPEHVVVVVTQLHMVRSAVCHMNCHCPRCQQVSLLDVSATAGGLNYNLVRNIVKLKLYVISISVFN